MSHSSFRYVRHYLLGRRVRGRRGEQASSLLPCHLSSSAALATTAREHQRPPPPCDCNTIFFPPKIQQQERGRTVLKASNHLKHRRGWQNFPLVHSLLGGSRSSALGRRRPTTARPMMTLAPSVPGGREAIFPVLHPCSLHRRFMSPSLLLLSSSSSSSSFQNVSGRGGEEVGGLRSEGAVFTRVGKAREGRHGRGGMGENRRTSTEISSVDGDEEKRGEGEGYQSRGRRISKWLSDAGHCSRRAAERLVAEGRVFVDGEVSRKREKKGERSEKDSKKQREREKEGQR